jgi:glycerophosphoryl diester phosphodiesterase
LLHNKCYAHRGANWIVPENTIIAFQEAYDHNFQGVELDVQLSQDGVPYIFHDDSLFRQFSYKQQFFKTHSNDIKKLTWRNQKIPTLEEFLSLFAHKEFYLELKIPRLADHKYMESLAKICLHIAPKCPKVVFASFEDKMLNLIPELKPICIRENSYGKQKQKYSLDYQFWQRNPTFKTDFLWNVPQTLNTNLSPQITLILDTFIQNIKLLYRT